jgi:ketosteroid isomerase-like protein
VTAPVRQPLSQAKHTRRTLDERIALRFPGVGAVLARQIARLSPGARLRAAAIARIASLAFQAYNRRDLAAAVAYCHPDFDYRPARRWVEAGLVEESYRGLEDYKRYVATVDQVWGGENYLYPREVIDFGDRVMVLADGTMRGQASGVPLNGEFAMLCALKDGRTIRAEEFYDHEEALALVGLSA